MKKIVRKDNSRRKKILSIGLVLFLFMGIGYSVISTNLLFNGNIELSKYESPYLYDVLKNEALSGGLAKKYTGNHHDSFTEEPSKDIYHWYATSDSEGTEVKNKNNVIFADHCWQMIRTTDTGGVKMIYNGEVENGQCLNTRGTHVGYDGRYSFSSGDTLTLNNSYWYGDDYTYDTINHVFSISGSTEQQVWGNSNYENLIGKYTCRQTTAIQTCSTIYLIESYKSATEAKVLPISNNSNYSVIGQTGTNDYKSLAYSGYMYNNLYEMQNANLSINNSLFRAIPFLSGMWCADSVSYDINTGNYSLLNPTQYNAIGNYLDLIGKYTFFNSSQTYISGSLYYIVGIKNNNVLYVKELKNGKSLSDYEPLIMGDSYLENNNNYSLTNTHNVSLIDWFNNNSNYVGKYICDNNISNSCTDSVNYIASVLFNSFRYFSSSNKIKFSNDFIWDGTKYILNNNSSVIWDFKSEDLVNRHYTCLNETGECTSVFYVYNLFENSTLTFNYIVLSNGDNVSDAINKMLYNNDVNQNNSIYKSGIEAWYKKYLLSYDEYIEDTIYCNDRIIDDLGGWDPNGGNPSSPLVFKSNNDLSCQNNTDKFSVQNSIARLNYKTGLSTFSEINLLNNSNILATGEYFWLGTPAKIFGDVFQRYSVQNDGSIFANYTYNVNGIRPVISLKPGSEYIYGNGSMEDPYVVKTKKECTYNGELTQGAEFVDGQYTYSYMQEYSISGWENIDEEGWGVTLTDKNSTDPVTTKLCTSINNKPIVSMQNMFFESNATSIDLSSFDTSNVTNMAGMFLLSHSNSLDLRSFDTSKVTDMGNMFEASSAITINMSNLNTSKVTNMGNMFQDSNVHILDLRSFDTRKVTNMSYMFSYCQATSIDVSSFNTSKVTDMSSMFANVNVTENSLDISSFDNSNVTNYEYIFCNVPQNRIVTGSKFTMKDDMFNCGMPA